MRRSILTVFLALALVGGLSAQAEMPKPRAVEKEYRSDYREALREAEQVTERLAEEEWDIVLPIEERVPTRYFDGAGVQAIDHWGKGLLLPKALEERLLRECTGKVTGKISDTGVDEEHPELKGAWWLPEADYTGDARPIHLHGTHVAGIAFSLLEPLVRTQVVNFKDIRNLNADGAGNFSTAASMLATERKQDETLLAGGRAVVYNFSWGGMRGIEPGMDAELQKSAALGILFVAAAGNNGPAVAPSYPASSPWVVATASLDESLKVSSYSTRGEFVDNAMPGRNINSTVPGGGFATLSGTSMASPMLFAASIIAKSKYGAAIKDTEALHKYLAAIAADLDPAGWDNASGWGLNYIVKILDTRPEDVIGNPPPPPPPPPAPSNVVQATFSDYSLRWQVSGSTAYQVMYFPLLRLRITGTGKGEALWDRLNEWLPTYFLNRGLILTSAMSAEDAAFYAGKFLELIAKDNGLTVQVLELTGQDERGRNYYQNGFSVKAVMDPNVKLVPIE